MAERVPTQRITVVSSSRTDIERGTSTCVGFNTENSSRAKEPVPATIKSLKISMKEVLRQEWS